MNAFFHFGTHPKDLNYFDDFHQRDHQLIRTTNFKFIYHFIESCLSRSSSPVVLVYNNHANYEYLHKKIKSERIALYHIDKIITKDLSTFKHSHFILFQAETASRWSKNFNVKLHLFIEKLNRLSSIKSTGFSTSCFLETAIDYAHLFQKKFIDFVWTDQDFSNLFGDLQCQILKINPSTTQLPFLFEDQHFINGLAYLEQIISNQSNLKKGKSVLIVHGYNDFLEQVTTHKIDFPHLRHIALSPKLKRLANLFEADQTPIFTFEEWKKSKQSALYIGTANDIPNWIDLPLNFLAQIGFLDPELSYRTASTHKKTRHIWIPFKHFDNALPKTSKWNIRPFNIQKEQLIINELFDEISYPSLLENQNDLTHFIQKETGISCQIILEGHRLYLSDQSSKESFGYLDFSSVHMNQETLHPTLDAVNKYVTQFQKGSENSLNWLKKRFAIPPIPGISFQIEKMKSGTSKVIPIHFENDRRKLINEIVRLLGKEGTVLAKINIILKNGAALTINLDEKLFRSSIADACILSITKEDFIFHLSRCYKTKIASRDRQNQIFYPDYQVEFILPQEDKTHQAIEQCILKMRTQQDTLNALSYLVNLGIIEDITFKDQQCLVEIKKRTPSFHLDQLYQICQGPFIQPHPPIKENNRKNIPTHLVQWIDQHIQKHFNEVDHDFDQNLDSLGFSIRQFFQSKMMSSYYFQYPILSQLQKTSKSNLDLLIDFMAEPLKKSATFTTFSFTHFQQCIDLILQQSQHPFVYIWKQSIELLLDFPFEKEKITYTENHVLYYNQMAEGFLWLKKEFSLNQTELFTLFDRFSTLMQSFDPNLTDFFNKLRIYINTEMQNQWVKQIMQQVVPK